MLEKILAMLASGGYAVTFDLYNAAYFGVAQQRERLILIGSRDGRVPYLAPTHSDRPSDGLPPWRTLRDAIGNMNSFAHEWVQFPERRLEYFKKLKAGQNWRDLSADDQRAALSEAVLDAPGGKSAFSGGWHGTSRVRRWSACRPCPPRTSAIPRNSARSVSRSTRGSKECRAVGNCAATSKAGTSSSAMPSPSCSVER